MTRVAMGLPVSSSTLRGKALLSKAAPLGCHRRGLAGGVRSSADEHRSPLLRDPASRAALLCASISSASLLVQGAAAASAVVAKQQASAENLTVPVFLSLLLAGAVYGASTDPTLRRLVEESTKPSSTGEPPVKEPLASTSSESKPSSALAGRPMPQLAAAVKAPEPPAVLAVERPAPEAAVLHPSEAPATSAPAQSAPMPVEVPPVEAAIMSLAAAEPIAPPAAAAAGPPLPAPAAAAPAAVEDTAASPRVQSFFQHAAEGARNMQAQYVEKIAGVRAQMARREQEEARRRDLRQAKISSLQAAAAAEAPAQPAQQPDANHAQQGPLARIMGLAVSVWLWIKHHVEKLLGHSSSGSSSSSGVAPSSA